MHKCNANEGLSARNSSAEPIILHGLLDIAVEEYTDWQRSWVSNETFRDNINEAREMTLGSCLNFT
ncbi:hypothetical protein N7465_004356 [Penicillium sp. CMV-2018d]|nr:hypothetical protein N7465_004356 [Penicillium sp. CMV-2018d]